VAFRRKCARDFKGVWRQAFEDGPKGSGYRLPIICTPEELLEGNASRNVSSVTPACSINPRRVPGLISPVSFAAVGNADNQEHELVIVNLIHNAVVAHPHPPNIIFAQKLHATWRAGIRRQSINRLADPFSQPGVQAFFQPVRRPGRKFDAVAAHARPSRALTSLHATGGRLSRRTAATARRSAASSRRSISVPM